MGTKQIPGTTASGWNFSFPRSHSSGVSLRTRAPPRGRHAVNERRRKRVEIGGGQAQLTQSTGRKPQGQDRLECGFPFPRRCRRRTRRMAGCGTIADVKVKSSSATRDTPADSLSTRLDQQAGGMVPVRRVPMSASVGTRDPVAGNRSRWERGRGPLFRADGILGLPGRFGQRRAPAEQRQPRRGLVFGFSGGKASPDGSVGANAAEGKIRRRRIDEIDTSLLPMEPACDAVATLHTTVDEAAC